VTRVEGGDGDPRGHGTADIPRTGPREDTRGGTCPLCGAAYAAYLANHLDGDCPEAADRGER
jgi:hypothetical protein